MKRPAQLPQWLRFGLVGAAATAVHATVYLLAGRLGVAPLQSNAAAFAVAFALSFAGNRYWVFASRAQWSRSLLRFFLTSSLGLASNSLMVWLLVVQLQWPRASALPGMLLLTPALVFACNKWWAFAEPRDAVPLR